MSGAGKRGAGLLPFSVHGSSVKFLLHQTFSGRRKGLLVDFGGGAEEGETHIDTATREFVEETEGLFFARQYDRVTQQALLTTWIEETQKDHPDWWLSRHDKSGEGLRDWKTFAVRVTWRDVAPMNQAWEDDNGKTFKKRRRLLWLTANQFADTLENEPGKCWNRLLQLQDLARLVRTIGKKAG